MVLIILWLHVTIGYVALFYNVLECFANPCGVDIVFFFCSASVDIVFISGENLT